MIAADRALAVRVANFGDGIDFFAPALKQYQTTEFKPKNPRAFVPLSVTGGACALQCDHCAAKVIKPMVSVPAGPGLYESAVALAAAGTKGILVSGGSQKDGEVPLLKHLDAMARIKQDLGMRVVVHTGLVRRRELAQGLAAAGIDAAMLDIIGANETIRDVYHLGDTTVDDFERALALLAEAGLRIIPHIVIGLHFAQLLGEDNALEIISRYPVSTLVLVVLTPLVGTAMAHLEPPPVADVSAFFGRARDRLPTTKVNLGCARPLGGMKVQLDQAAIDHGLNGIAYPAEGSVAYARSRGLEPRFYDYCCSLTWVEAVA